MSGKPYVGTAEAISRRESVLGCMWDYDRTGLGRRRQVTPGKVLRRGQLNNNGIAPG
jgi:hypothetical protein